jgi:NCS1 family nucleobase:cation symporter-1
LPATIGLYSFIGVAATSATVVIYGRAVWDPVVLLWRFENPVLHVVELVGLGLATLATNLVGPANDFANFWPCRISFCGGALITGVVSVVIQPCRRGGVYTHLLTTSTERGAADGHRLRPDRGAV